MIDKINKHIKAIHYSISSWPHKECRREKDIIFIRENDMTQKLNMEARLVQWNVLSSPIFR